MERAGGTQGGTRALQRLLLAGIGLVYVVAFLSLAVQIEGLVGSGGILPNAPYFTALSEHTAATFADAPSLCWGDGCGDATLLALCLSGAAAGGSLLLGFAALPAAAFAWFAYLSLFSAGQIFLGYQWDLLLLEAGFLALLAAAWRDAWPPLPIWLFRWLLFRLVFASGVVKLSSGDPTWRDLTALAFHYETQPIPYWTSWWMHQLPLPLQKASTAAALATELLAPLLYAGPRRARQLGAALTAVLMLLIGATGNYGFFNLLTLVLCLSLLDDAALPERLRRLGAGADAPRPPTPRTLRIAVLAPLVLWLLVASLVPVLSAFRVAAPAPLAAVYGWQHGFRMVNGYGLFATMTTERPEIDVQGSADGRTWQSYGFRYKVGDPNDAPRFAGPHMPRLDWQLWFAALRGADRVRWLRTFALALLEGRPDVLALLADDPFAEAPPRQVRVRLDLYRFSDYATGRDSGAWWTITQGHTAFVASPRGGAP